LPVTEAALRWIRRRAFPIPVEFRGKRPIGESWQLQRITAADVPEKFAGELNVGVLWGECSGGLVDVDCDWPEAADLATRLLPPTAVYDRTGARNSHRIYRVPGAKTRRWELPPALVPENRRAAVLELRADGCQSVVPPSTHPSGEVYCWRSQQKPRELEHQTLLKRLNLVAAGALFCRYWKQGTRHQLSLALSGAMLTSGYSVEEVAALIVAVAEVAGDEDAKDRARAVQSSSEAIAVRRPATGLPKLAELVGDLAVVALKRWLNLGTAIPAGIQSGGVTPDPLDDSEVLQMRCAANIERRPLSWLWPQRIPRAKLSMIAGRQDGGKSTLVAEIIAHITRGTPWPLDGSPCPVGDVLIVNVEDDPGDTIRPRLEAAGADLGKVQIIDAVMRLADKKERQVTLADVGIVDALLTQCPGRFALLTIDPIGAFMAGRDSHRDAEVRELLAPFSMLAAKHNIAILLVAHLSKAVGMDALYRVLGSVGFTAAVRSVYFVIVDPGDDARRLFVAVKGNNVAVKMIGLAFTLQNVDLGDGVAAARVCWQSGGEMRSADELLAPRQPESPERADAEAWLQERLAKGAVAVAVLKTEAPLEVEASWPTIERAARDIGIVGRGEKRARTWELPPESLPSAQAEQTIKQDGDGKDGKQTTTTDGKQTIQTITITCDGKLVGADVKPDSEQQQAEQNDGPVVMQNDNDCAVVLPAAPVTEPAVLHPCTACEKLSLTRFCSHYQRVLPEPAKPNACIHFEQRKPDLPWQ
jgi:hypothetical protein